MKFSYTARAHDGSLSQGQMDSANEEALAHYLHTQGLLLTKAEPLDAEEKTANKRQLAFHFGSGVKATEKVFFAQNLQVMVKAGLPVSTALKTLGQQTNNKIFQQILSQIHETVDRGVPLSDALAAHPKIFNELFVNMVRAGEKSGKLEDVLAQLANQIRKNYTLISKVRGALTYPVIVILAMIGIAIAMIVFVIPQITGIFEEVNADLPLPTQILIAVSDFTVAYWWLLLIASAIAIAAFIKIIHTSAGRYAWHGLLLKVPIVSPILQKINLAKFSRTFSSLMKTDIPIVQTLSITASTLGNSHYRAAIENASERIKKGVPIASVIGEFPKLFPPLVIQMISVGEETGTMDSILEELATFYEEDVDRTMSSLSTVLEPVLILLLGLGVAGLAIAIIMPIYSLTQNV